MKARWNHQINQEQFSLISSDHNDSMELAQYAFFAGCLAYVPTAGDSLAKVHRAENF